MIAKIAIVFALASVASAGVVGGPIAYAGGPAYGAAPIVAKAVVSEDFDYNPQYSYGYSVQDGLTGDSKTASESRNGDSVQGQYSLVEPDGSVRTVTYTADDIHGFNAVVDRQAPGVVKSHAPVVAKVHAAHPVAYSTGPVGYAGGPVPHGAVAYGARPIARVY